MKLVPSPELAKVLPYFTQGPIIKGFGRGSRELGIPTANFPLDVVKSLPEVINRGIYFGWASVDNGSVHKMVMSIGWNPFFDNTEKSMETHIIHNFNGDLYGCSLKVCITGYLRPEMNFSSLDALIEAIQKDIKQASELLDKSEYLRYKDYDFFKNSA